jgi:CubicO group peptidase (beta-lactamase class C family)
MQERAWTLTLTLIALLAVPATSSAAPGASALLPRDVIVAGHAAAEPVANAVFFPGEGAMPAAAFTGRIEIRQTALQARPAIEHPLLDGRDARLFPGVTLEFVTLGDVLVPVQRGEMLRETAPGAVPSYWRVIAQFGRTWHEAADGDWSRAAFPLMLVNDTENHAHQGLATFMYRGTEVSAVQLQFVQQTAPYLLHQHFIMWGVAAATSSAGDPAQLEARRNAARVELAARLPSKPWSELVRTAPPGTLDGFGGPLYPQWRVAAALVRDGTLYYQESQTAYGPYPYTLEMRFGVRSIMKSVAAPLALLRLAEVYGPYVLKLNIGDYVPGLDPKWQRIRFGDAVNMATGFGGVGSIVTHPNDPYSGYLEAEYDAWYTAPSQADKLQQIVRNLKPYPWEPGTVMRYRDQDFFVLGAAIEGFLKSVRGPQADLWDMLKEEVFAPIGIMHAPAVRTREPDGRDGLVWCSAGYYPTMDDLAKIALLYQGRGAWKGRQILHRQLTTDLMAARDALRKSGDAASGEPLHPGEDTQLYKMGLHFAPYVGSGSHRLQYLPMMTGSGENEVVMYPNGLVSMRMAKAAELPKDTRASADDAAVTFRAVDRLAPF